MKLIISIASFGLLIFLGILFVWSKQYPERGPISLFIPSPSSYSQTPNPSIINNINNLVTSPKSSATPTANPTVRPTPNITQTPMPTNHLIPQEIVWGNRNKQIVIFTFDAGAGNQSFQPIMDLLKKYNLKSSFFITGTWAENNSSLVKQIAQEGHEIYNHTYTHPHLTQSDGEIITSELSRTDQLITSLTGHSTKPYFRPPYGDRNQRVLQTAANAGYQSVYWTIDAWDWRENEGYTAEQIKARVYTNLQPGTIYLFHIGDNITGNILEEVINNIQSKGYQIVSLSEGIR